MRKNHSMMKMFAGMAMALAGNDVATKRAVADLNFKSGVSGDRVVMTKKQWAKTKAKRAIQKQSRKINR